MTKNKGSSIPNKSNLVSLQDLDKRIGRRTKHNKENVVNQHYHVPPSRLEQALVDYAFGQFRFKKEVAKKYKMSAQTLVRHANLRGDHFH